MLDLLETALEGLNIIEFQYGKTHPSKAWPVIGFEASPPELEVLGRRLNDLGIAHEDVTSQADVDFRIIHYEARLFTNPFFIHLEFPERAGALHDFLVSLRGIANMCYFNYAYSGERVGRALMGFEFDSPDGRAGFQRVLKASGWTFRELSAPVLHRIL
jgi:threonine dehydratase